MMLLRWRSRTQNRRGDHCPNHLSFPEQGPPACGFDSNQKNSRPPITPPVGGPLGSPSKTTITPSQAPQARAVRPRGIEAEPPFQQSETPTSALIYPKNLSPVNQTGVLKHADIAAMDAALVVQYEGGQLEQVISLTDKIKGGSECAAVYSTTTRNGPVPWVMKAFLADGAPARTMEAFQRKQARYQELSAIQSRIRQDSPNTHAILLPQSNYLRATNHPLLLQFQQRMRLGPDHRLSSADWDHILTTIRRNNLMQLNDQKLRRNALSAFNQKISRYLTHHPVLQALPEGAKRPLEIVVPGAPEPQLADLKYHNVELRLKRQPNGQIMLDDDGLPEFDKVRIADLYGGNVGIPNAWHLAQDWDTRWHSHWQKYRLAPTIDAADGGATPIHSTPT